MASSSNAGEKFLPKRAKLIGQLRNLYSWRTGGYQCLRRL